MIRDRLGATVFAAIAKRSGLREPVVRQVRRERDLRATMSDGCVLLADHWIPAGQVQAPLLLVRSPYGRRGVIGTFYGRYFAHQGFQVVVQSCRGTADSGGQFDRPFAAESADGRDTVRWLRDQPFYPGSFGTVGPSYLGFTQLALPAEAKVDLFGAVLQIAPTSVRDVAWPDDAFGLQTALGWSLAANRNPASTVRNFSSARADRRKLRDAAASDRPLMTSYLDIAGKIPFFEQWLTHQDAADGWWQDLDVGASLETFDCPVLVQSGWYDQFLESSLHQFQRLSERGMNPQLTVGPWSHSTFASEGARVTFTEAAQFLRRACGLDPLDPEAAPMTLIEIGSGEVLRLREWPVTVEQTWHLHTEGRLRPDPPSPDGGSTSFRYDPADPTPSVGGAVVDDLGGPKDNAALEARADVITFDTEPLLRRTRILGAATVQFSLSSDRPATQVFVRLCRVGVTGASTNVTDRLVTLAADEQVDAGRWQVSVRLPPTSLAVAPGERLRLQISGGAFPRFVRCPGTGDPPATARTFVAAQQTLHHDAEQPASVTVPVGRL